MSRINYNSLIIDSNHQYVNYLNPITVFMKITSKCMFNCSFCSQGDLNNCEMDINIVKKIMKKLKRSGVLRIFYTGGEPFLHSKFDEILQYGNSLGFCQLIISNGFMLDNPKVKKMLNYVSGISISLHGKEDTHNRIVGNKNSYSKIIKNVTMLKEAFPNIMLDICYTVNNENVNNDDIISVANFCKNNDLNLTITRTYIIGKAKLNVNFEYINKLVKIVHQLRKKDYKIFIGHCLVPCSINDEYKYLCSSCSAGIDFCAVEMNGDVKICANSMEVIGNLKKTSFKKIWKKNNKILSKRINNLSVICSNCTNFSSCIGGCKCETEKISNGLCDFLALSIINKCWHEIKSDKMIPNIACIKKIGVNKYLIISKKNCIINKRMYKFINKIDFSITLEENLNKNFNIKYNELKELFVLLYKNEIIKRDENE